MVIESRTKHKTLDELPDITESISKVIRYYNEFLDNTYDYYDSENIIKFVDVWLAVQKDQAIRLHYGHKQQQAKSLFVS